MFTCAGCMSQGIGKTCTTTDADEYCKLRLCDSRATAKGSITTHAAPANQPGFSCYDISAIPGNSNLGAWFGKDVWYLTNVRGTAGPIDVLLNVPCDSGKHSQRRT